MYRIVACLVLALIAVLLLLVVATRNDPPATGKQVTRVRESATNTAQAEVQAEHHEARARIVLTTPVEPASAAKAAQWENAEHIYNTWLENRK